MDPTELSQAGFVVLEHINALNIWFGTQRLQIMPYSIFLLHCFVYGGLWGKCSSYISTELYAKVSLIRVKGSYAFTTLHLVLCKKITVHDT